jgi:hypothetical protein
VVNRFCKEFHMNRVFTTIALQSAIAAVVIAAVPPANADPVLDPLVPAPTGSVASRAEVQQAAIEARDARLRSMVSVETLLDPTSAPFVSTANRAQVRAEAREATRLGLTSSYDGKAPPSAEQLAQIRAAGQRASAASDQMAAKR